MTCMALLWWTSLLIAITSCLRFHAVAELPMPATSNLRPEEIGKMVGNQVFKTLSAYLQYIVPAIFVVGAIASTLDRWRRRRLLADSRGTRDALASLTWQKFEQLVGEAFRQRGYTVSETGQGGPDGGIDLTLRSNGARFLVQCKHWRAGKVPVKVVRELLGVMTAQRAAGAFVVTSDGFTNEAWTFARITASHRSAGKSFWR